MGNNNHKKNLLLLFVFTVAVLYAISNTANAENSKFISSFKEVAIYSSNPLMRRDNVFSIIGTETIAALNYNNETTRTALKSKLFVTRNQFNNSKFSSTDASGFTGLRLDRNRWKVAVKTKIDYDTVRTSEITTFNFDINSTRKISYSVEPSISYDLSQRNFVTVSGSYNNKRYEDNSLTDYHTYSITSSFSHNMSLTQLIQLSLLFNQYKSLDNSKQHVNTAGSSISWSYAFKPYLSIKLSGSLLKTKYFGYTNSKQQNSYTPTYEAILNYTGKNQYTSLSIIKSRQPYANGTESYLTTLAMQNRYALSKNMTLNLEAQYQDAKQPPISGDNLETAWNISTGTSYKFSRNWDLTTSYKHKEETLTNDNNAARQDVIRIGLLRAF